MKIFTKSWRTGRQTDRQNDGHKNGHMDGETDNQTYGHIDGQKDNCIIVEQLCYQKNMSKYIQFNLFDLIK